MKIKKILFIVLIIFSLCFLTYCGKANEQSASEESQTSSVESEESVIEHNHSVVKILAQASTCKTEGNVEFYYCAGCMGYFLDEDLQISCSYEQTRLEKSSHSVEKSQGVSPTCGESGIREHWTCTDCGKHFEDEECTKGLLESQLVIPTINHINLEYNEGFPINGDENGQIEHWYCPDCDGYFTDGLGEIRVDKEELILYSAVNIPDFIVEIESGKDPVVLQLTDTQIIDGAQLRPGECSSGDKITYATALIKNYCYDYLTEIITETKPDFIIITGDIIYGKYDDNGSVLKAFIDFMDGFEIPWSPVFGNHDNESKKGVDWQCEQLKNGKYCLFEQKTLTGNGNYSVGLKQDGKIKRVFYMLDTNGCSHASEETKMNSHFTRIVGFGDDQIAWYTDQITRLKELSPDTKISFAYHIQQSVFGEALTKYGFNQSVQGQDIHIDYLSNKESSDFGYIGRCMKDPWDHSKAIFNGMKALGVDLIFVGHEHCNSSSVVYEGVRLQYGQKSSEYDRYNCVTSGNTIVDSQIWNKAGEALVGGSVVVLSSTDGQIKDSYIYYCKNAGGELDWDKIGQNYTK